MYVAAVASSMAWIYGGTLSWPLVKSVPWLMLFMAEILFIFPQRHTNETTYDARERAWERMRKDPVVWTAFGLILLLIVPFVNNGLCTNCDATLIAQGVDPEAPAPFLPFCVDRLDHLNVFLWFVTAMSCLVATRHCLTKSGKRLMVELIVWSGAALAIMGFVQIATEAPGPFWQDVPGSPGSQYFATWGYVNMAGDYFTTIFAMAIAVWRWRFDEEHEKALEISSQSHAKPRDLFWKQNLYLLPAVICFFAAVNTLSRSAIVMASSLALLFFVHTFISFTARISRVQRVKATAICGLVLFIIAFFVISFTPKGVKKEMKTVDATEALQRITGKSENHVTVATEIWKDHLLFGCGGWGYRHFAYSKMDPKVVAERKKANNQGGGGANVHNDYMQFLCEHGLVGLGALLALVLMLLSPCFRQWKAMVRSLRFADKKKRPPRPVQIFVIPAPVFCIFMALVATFVHGFMDCPFRTPAILTLFFVLLSAIEGFMPEIDSEQDGRSHHH